MKHVTATFLKGLFTLLPAILSLYAILWFLNWVEGFSRSVLLVFWPEFLYVPGLGVLLVVLIMYGVGSIVDRPFAKWFFRMAEGLMVELPVVKTVYLAIKDFTDFLKPNRERRDQVVLVKFPGGQIEMIGLMTRENLRDLPEPVTKSARVAVYFPMSYQFGGATVFLPREWVHPTNLSVEAAMRSIITAWLPGHDKKLEGYMSVQLINPANGEVISDMQEHTAGELESAVADSLEAYGHWRKTSLEVRLQSVRDFATAVHESRAELAALMTREMGKTLKDSLAEADKCAASCRTLADEFPKWLKHAEHKTPAGHHVTRQSLGPLLGIMPWNFPLWQVVRFAVPAMLCGNSILLKHAPNTWGSAEMIEDLFHRAFPDRLYVNLRIGVETAGKVIADPRVRGVSLTGSRAAGMSVGAQAGAALKKCVLELGGSDAYVVLDDADVKLAADICVQSRLLNAGQSCVAAKRFIVTKKNVEEFTEKMRAGLSAKTFGDPVAAATDFGPLARKDLRDQLHQQVERSVKSGSKLELGGKVPDHKGFFYPASLLSQVKPGQAAFDEELFGPVAAVITAQDEADAFRLANLSRYGLGGAVFSRDVERAKALATTEMDAGMVAINDFVKSDALAPFGGVKDSGLGRELGPDGVLEFTNIKTVFAKA